MTETTIHADHQDRFVVAPTGFQQVRADVIESDGTEITTYLEPAAARQLARALKRAANVAEGKPAKPKTFVDGVGDTWTANGRNEDGKRVYQFSGNGSKLTRARIKELYPRSDS